MPTMSVKQRAVGAVVGALVADAAAAPLHWIYDRKKLGDIVATLDHPEFAPQGHCPFYTITTGRNSGVGDQTIALLQSLVHSKGYDSTDYCKRLHAAFGPDSDYEVNRDVMPVTGPWRPGQLKAFLENYAAGVVPPGHKGSANGDAHGKVAPIVALLAGQAGLLDTVDVVTRVTHDDAVSVAYAKAGAQLLEQYILHGASADPPVTILDKLAKETDGQVSESIQQVLEAAQADHHDTIQKYGSQCSYPMHFKCTLHALVKANMSDFTSVRETLSGAGDNTPRAAFLGACLGAVNGVQGIPKEWQEKTLRFNEIVDLAEKLVAGRYD